MIIQILFCCFVFLGLAFLFVANAETVLQGNSVT
jgi:hypothetical protein